VHEGFRIVAMSPQDMRQLNRHWGAVKIPKLGWVRFRWSRAVPAATSYPVRCDRAGRWHVAFAAIPALANGLVVGVDRGVAVSAALSTRELLAAPALRPAEARRLRRLQRRLTRAERGSTRRGQVKRAVARLHARAADRRTNWVEQTSTDLARRGDLIRIEDLDVRAMTKCAKGTVERPGKRVRQKAGLNRGILGCVARAWTGNADVDAARNIAAGRAVPARGGLGSPGPVNREPHHVASSVA
jgi:putative transposase